MLVPLLLLWSMTLTNGLIFRQKRQSDIEHGAITDSQPRGNPVTREALRERLDSILILLTRISDRLVSVETKQNQQNERIDNVNYRITKLELISQERKSDLSDISNNLRHRLQTSDAASERIQDALDEIKLNTNAIVSDGVDIRMAITNLQNAGGGRISKRVNNKLQSLTAITLGVKGNTEKLLSTVQSLSRNVTGVDQSLRGLDKLQQEMVTKKDLFTVTTDLKTALAPKFSLQPSRLEGSARHIPTDCFEWHSKGHTISGIYRVQPTRSPTPFFVYCDMTTNGGGWTVIQNRQDGAIDFLRGWQDYKHGFGNLAGEFWLGNEKIHLITTDHVNELHIKLGDFSQTIETANYSAFAMGSETEGYALKLLGTYSGTAGDSLGFHVGHKWSTIDVDNDAHPDENCAREHTGAWWYKACDTSNLNGRYLHGPVPAEHEYQGMYWYGFNGPQYSLWKSTMMIRRGGGATIPDVTPPPINQHRYAIHDPEIMGFEQ